MYLPLSPISVLPVVIKCPLISGNNVLEGMGSLMIINYNRFVYYVEWRGVNHLVWGVCQQFVLLIVGWFIISIVCFGFTAVLVSLEI